MGRHYGLRCRLQNCKGCIEIKVVLMSEHYLQLKDLSDFEEFKLWNVYLSDCYLSQTINRVSGMLHQ